MRNTNNVTNETFQQTIIPIRTRLNSKAIGVDTNQVNTKNDSDQAKPWHKQYEDTHWTEQTRSRTTNEPILPRRRQNLVDPQDYQQWRSFPKKFISSFLLLVVAIVYTSCARDRMGSEYHSGMKWLGWHQLPATSYRHQYEYSTSNWICRYNRKQLDHLTTPE